MTTNDHGNLEQLAAARVRAGDADRERTADELRRAHVDGRIDSDELSERIGRCYQSKTFGELQRLTSDLVAPVPRGGLQPSHRRGRHPRQRLRIALAAIAAMWVLAVATQGAAGHAHPHPHAFVFAFLLVLAVAFLVSRLVHAVRA